MKYADAGVNIAVADAAKQRIRHHASRGTEILVSQWVMHRDPRYFAEPERFDPERWSDGLASRLPRYAYFPFGGGPRLCIGRSFATMEAILVLAAVAQRVRLEPRPGHRVVVEEAPELEASAVIRVHGPPPGARRDSVHPVSPSGPWRAVTASIW